MRKKKGKMQCNPPEAYRLAVGYKQMKKKPLMY